MITVLHEHPTWSLRLFEELEARAASFRALHVSELGAEDDAPVPPGLVVNRVGAGVTGEDRLGVLQRVGGFLAGCEQRGLDVVNGTAAFRFTVSKLRQYEALEQLGLGVPPYRVVDGSSDLAFRARRLRFPLLFKPNVGGSGGGMHSFATLDELREWTAPEPGPDGVGILQERVDSPDGCIVRVEMLAGRLLYALRVPVAKDCFDNCPVDLGARVAAYSPPAEVIEEARVTLAACSTEVGSVEYVERDGARHYFDVNPFSNFVSNPVELLGFDPTERFVDYLLARQA